MKYLIKIVCTVTLISGCALMKTADQKDAPKNTSSTTAVKESDKTTEPRGIASLRSLLRSLNSQYESRFLKFIQQVETFANVKYFEFLFDAILFNNEHALQQALLVLDDRPVYDLNFRMSREAFDLAAPQIRQKLANPSYRATRELPINGIYEGDTVLHLAARQNKPDAVKLLIKFKADCLSKNDAGEYPLDSHLNAVNCYRDRMRNLMVPLTEQQQENRGRNFFRSEEIIELLKAEMARAMAKKIEQAVQIKEAVPCFSTLDAQLVAEYAREI